MLFEWFAECIPEAGILSASWTEMPCIKSRRSSEVGSKKIKRLESTLVGCPELSATI
jgi:hypothetical protein